MFINKFHQTQNTNHMFNYLCTLSPIDHHIKFLALRVCHTNFMPNFYDDTINEEFNHGFGRAYNSIETEDEVYSMIDIYFQALGTMSDFAIDASFNNTSTTTHNKVIFIIEERLKKLRTLSRQVE